MTHTIRIGGQDRPLRFGMAALYRYEQITGRNAIDDFRQMQGPNGEIIVKLTVVVDLLYSGLVCGCISQRIAPDFIQEDVADWLTEDSDAVEKMMAFFVESLPHGNEKNAIAPQAAKAEA